MQRRDELDLLNRRITIVFGLIAVAFSVLAFGFWRAQVVLSPEYRQLADRNRIRDIELAAPRGRIYDREHRLLADSRPSYNLLLIREDSPRPYAETVRILASGVEATEQQMLERIARFVGRPEYEPIQLLEDLTTSEIAFVRARKYEMPEIRLEFRPQRRYPNGEVAAHLLGYVGEVSAEQLETPEFAGLGPGDTVGQFGLERQYDALLQGNDGVRRIIVNNFGREMGQIGEAPPTAGNDLVTTIDLDLQQVAEAALGDQTGVAVALIPETGELLALASRPAFDPTEFSQGIHPDKWRTLVSDPRKPLQNRAIQNRYSPGSIFKIFMTAAGLESGVVDLNEILMCHGHTTLYGNRFDCWNANGHGGLTIHDALVHSCNVFFYLVGDRLGIDRISEYALAMGLGRPTGIDLPGEDSGLIPSEEWKRETQNAPWYSGETISVSIGQGAVGVTPLQLTWAVGAVGIGGRLAQPHLVSPDRIREMHVDAAPLEHRQYPLHAETAEAIREALRGVVHEAGGTGSRARVAGIEIAGKTGTAQVVSSENAGENGEFQPHGWFVGFAPYDAPEVAVGVFVEHGGGGSVSAAPVAQQIFQAYFDKKAGVFTRDRSDGVARLEEGQ